MSDIHVQASFNGGEWSPTLFARVDLQKYRSGAALLENFFVDYRGGASTRPGSKYVIQAYRSNAPVRLIPFQGQFNQGYILEFGDGYMRPHFQGAPVLNSPFNITGATNANPCVLKVSGNTFIVGDWIFVQGVNGMTQLNNRYFSVLANDGTNVTIGTLNGANIDSTGYGAYTSGGTAASIYIIGSPFAAEDLALVKWTQNVEQMILVHPNYPPQVLTLNGPTNWTITDVSIGASIPPPTGLAVSSTLASGSMTYSYGVTAIDQNGQESNMSATAGLVNKVPMANNTTNKLTWNSVSGAVAYNVYEAVPFVTSLGAPPSGVPYGFIGTTQQPVFNDTNFGPNFSFAPPNAQNPFAGGNILTATATTPGSYTTIPTVTLSGGSPQIPGALSAVLGVNTHGFTDSGRGRSVGQVVHFPHGVVLVVATVNGIGTVTGFQPFSYPGSSRGSFVGPGNPPTYMDAIGIPGLRLINIVWGVFSLVITNHGAGYSSAPTVSFSPTGAAATVTVSPLGDNPGAVGYFQQRLIFAATSTQPQTFWASKTGYPFNFDTTIPTQPTDSISGTLVAGVLQTIKHIVPQPTGMLILTDKASWIINGGSPGSPITPTSIVANAHSFVGANDVRPIVANYDVLYVQSKGSAVRDLAFNVYFQIFTGTDISILSSHLFYGHQILDWAWAELPFYLVWALREDGVILTLTFLKEQDFVAWSHQVPAAGGLYKSVAAITEATASGNVDAVYTVVQRGSVQYIERIAERSFPGGVKDAWCVDAGLQYVGPPATTFQGADHLAGYTVTGLADGNIIPPFVMPSSGIFTLSQAASKVTIGLAFTAKLQTLAIDTGDPSIQGKVKKIPFVDVRVADTLGLQIGNDFNHLVPMKDLVVGNVSSMLAGQQTQIVGGLVSGDARTFLDPTYTVLGQYCIQQSNPYPATVLGVFPALVVGDTK